MLAAPVPSTKGLVALPDAILEPAAATPAPTFAAGRSQETPGAPDAPPPLAPDLNFNARLIKEFDRLHRPDGATPQAGATASLSASVGLVAADLAAVPPPAIFEDPASSRAIEVQLALLRCNALWLRTEPVRDDGLWVHVATDQAARFRDEGSDKGSLLQLRQADRPPLHIALPASPWSGYLFEVCRVPSPTRPRSEGDVVSVDFNVGNTDADALLRYLATGNLQNIETALAGDLTQTASQLQYDGFEDPVASSVGGHALLRFNRLERLARSDWTDGFYESTLWLPDSAVMHGEHLAP